MAISPNVPGAEVRAPSVAPATDDVLPLIEREASLAALQEHLGAVLRGSGRLVVVRGEAGIGKSALVERFLAGLPAGVGVLTGGFDGVSTPLPFAPLRDMAGRLGGDLADLLDANAELHVVRARLNELLATLDPAVVVIEDLQWADEATAETLTYQARRLSDARRLVILTYRDDDPPSPPVRRLLGQLAGMPAAHNLQLAPLSRKGVAVLAAGHATDPAELHRLTGGNPFFVQQVLASGTAEIPLSISDALRARLDGLGARARSALEAAAILGSRIEPWLLAAVAGEDILGADDCIAAGLLTKGEALAFRHELTRLAVMEALPVFKGIGLHRRALDALLRSGSTDDARLAYHSEGAADAARVLRHAVAAGDAAMRVGANHEAVAQFQRAMAFAGHASEEDHAAILERLSYVQYMTNQVQEARVTREEAVALRRKLGDSLRVGDGLRHLSRLAWTHGSGAESWELSREAIRILEPLGETRELAMALANLGGLYMIVKDTVEGRSYSERAMEMGRRLGEPEPIAYALNNLGCIAMWEGDERGEELLLESYRLCNEKALFESAHRAIFNLFCNFADIREPIRAETYLAQIIDYTSGVQIERCNLDCAASELKMDIGDWAEGERLALRALEYARAQSDDRGQGMVTLAQLAIRRGEEGGTAFLANAERYLAGFESAAHTHPIVLTRAEAAWLDGTLEEQVEPLRQVLSWAIAADDPWEIGDAARWLWQAGALPDVPARTAEPYKMVMRGDHRSAAEEFDRRPLPYEAALALALSGEASDLQEAHDRLLALGATAVARKVAGDLRRVGAAVPRGPRRDTRANPANLTARQMEIARLVARGLTNREIAGELVLTEKTVGHHVSAVLAKLGAQRRTEVAALLGAAAA